MAAVKSKKLSKNLKKGVQVEVIAGKYKGKTGSVLKVMESKQRILVEKCNLVKRHSKPNAKLQQGGVIEKEASIHWSNVKVVGA